MSIYSAQKLQVINIYPQYLWINLCLSTFQRNYCLKINLQDIQNGSLHHKQLESIRDDFQFPPHLIFFDVSF